MVDVYLQARRDGAAAKRFFRRLLRSHGGEPRKIVTDKLRSYGVAHRELIPETIHSTKQYENNRAEQSHEATRVRERGMRRFKSVKPVLYISMWSTIQYDPKIKATYERLLAAGKPKKVALVACMRKQLTILNTMMKNGTHWNEKLA